MIKPSENLFQCDFCPTKVDGLKKLHRIKKNGKKMDFCIECYRKNRKGFRSECKQESVIQEQKEIIVRTLGNPVEERPTKKHIPLRYKTEEEKQRIRNYQEKPKTYLSYEECKILWKKYLDSGLEPKEASAKVSKIKKELYALTKQMRAKNKSEEEIANNFRKKFLEMANG